MSKIHCINEESGTTRCGRHLAPKFNRTIDILLANDNLFIKLLKSKNVDCCKHCVVIINNN